jgi:hypothetical protein
MPGVRKRGTKGLAVMGLFGDSMRGYEFWWRTGE